MIVLSLIHVRLFVHFIRDNTVSQSIFILFLFCDFFFLTSFLFILPYLLIEQKENFKWFVVLKRLLLMVFRCRL